MSYNGIEEAISQLYEMVQEARAVPLSSEKCMVERDRILDLLDEISNELPGELKQAKTIVDSRSEVITSAKRDAEAIRKQAQLEAKQMASQEAIYQEAKAQAELVAAQDDAAVSKARNTSKTVKLAKGKTKTTKKQSVTLKAITSASGAKVTYKKSSGSSKVSVKSGKAYLAKGVKKGTYKATVKATCGTQTAKITVKFVVK